MAGLKILIFSLGLVVAVTLIAHWQCTVHVKEVVGLCCDATNGSLVSAGYSGDIKV